VLAGAHGGHRFTAAKSPHFKDVYDTANRYHLVHSAVLALAPAASAHPHVVRAPPCQRVRRDAHANARLARAQVGGLFGGGTLLFCSSLYHLGVTENRAHRMRKVGPVGASMLVAGWLALALGA
jgi:uncharacterized membrane protein YgdD (TMEM256/DUF423 family)